MMENKFLTQEQFDNPKFKSWLAANEYVKRNPDFEDYTKTITMAGGMQGTIRIFISKDGGYAHPAVDVYFTYLQNISRHTPAELSEIFSTRADLNMVIAKEFSNLSYFLDYILVR